MAETKKQKAIRFIDEQLRKLNEIQVGQERAWKAQSLSVLETYPGGTNSITLSFMDAELRYVNNNAIFELASNFNLMVSASSYIIEHGLHKKTLDLTKIHRKWFY